MASAGTGGRTWATGIEPLLDYLCERRQPLAPWCRILPGGSQGQELIQLRLGVGSVYP
ncbi:MAG: hypothetical protein M3083_21285 [Actinomycetota bacterium]|nr:hypothetical protein [Actinomycetota bacterium]